MSDAGTLHFRLPSERWRPADPEQTRLAGAAYVAYRTGDESPFATNITVTGQTLAQEASLESVAETSYADLAAAHPGARLDQREAYGVGATPGLVQLVTFTVEVDDQPLELQQCQVLLRADNQQDGEVAALLYLVALTGPTERVREVVPEFQEFLRSITVEGSSDT